jgi:hypothetical protein
MKTHCMTFSPRALAAVCGIALAAGAVIPAQAHDWDQRTVLTVDNQPLQVRDVVLDPGTYVIKQLHTNSIRNFVQIYTADERQLVDTVQAIPVYRARPTGDTQFTYWETPNGTARALRTWFYPGETIGESFPYPDHPRELLASVSEPPLEALNTRPAEPAEPEAAPPGPSANAEEQPVEMAANSAGPEPAPTPEPAAEPTPAAEPAPAAEPQSAADQPASAPAEMPKTASPFPLIGLCGAFSLCLGGLFRLIRSS